MMKLNNYLAIGFTLTIVLNVFGQPKINIPTNLAPLKPRIVVLTDVSTWETDDSESLVRLLVYADMFEIEGLIYTTGWSLEETRPDFFQLIHNAIDAYEKDLPNLKKRSGQIGFNKDESKQKIGYWPTATYLRERSVIGSTKRGVKELGKNNISDGSNLIIELANEDDKRPLWVLLWGGGNTLAQAIWQVNQEQSAEDLKAFLHKIHTYAITDQDRSYKKNTPFNTSSQQWMRKEFQNDLMYLWDECAWKYQNNTGKENWGKYAEHIQSHGNLGSVYPKYKFGVEGDTPSFLHLMPNGLNNPSIPGEAGWGGYFEWDKGPDKITSAYTNYQGAANDVCKKYESYLYPHIFNDFVARMDWAHAGKGNRNPVVVINGKKGIAPIHIKKKKGKKIKLNASASLDPEGDLLRFKWWIQEEAGTYKGPITLADENSKKITIDIPHDSQGKNFHIICEVTDQGEPKLTSYRRIIINSLE